MNNKSNKKPIANIDKDDISSVPNHVTEVIKGLPEDKKNAIIAIFKAESKLHSGPLPDADTIRVYNECIPNGGDRLMCQVENQQTHRFELEKTGQKRLLNQSSIGQFMAFGIAISFGFFSWDLIKSDHDVAGGILGTADMVGLVYVFIQGKKRQ